MNNTPTFKIYTLGCKVNQYDSESLSRKLISAGFIVGESNVDLAIINTCTVTHSAIAKDKKMIERAKAENQNAKIAVVGCMPVNYKKEVEELGVNYILKTNEGDKLIEEVINTVKGLGACPPKLQRRREVGGACGEVYKTGKSRYFLKIQDGCQQFCSYCIIPYNRGKLTSRPADEVLEEVKKVVTLGYKEIILCGIHLGLYGVDFRRDAVNRVFTLVGLLKQLIKIEGLEKIRLSSIEVTEVNDELIELIKTERKICRHLHIPLQSGCDKILKLMNRPYTTAYFAERIEKLRIAVPEVAITNDVIVGFPGETEEDFAITFEYIKKINFSKLHVFPFSAHEKTPAFSMPNQLSSLVKKSRAKILAEYSFKLEADYKKKFVGQELDVIVDGRSKDGKFRGKTEYYFDIEFNSDKKLKAGELVRVKEWRFV